MNKYIIINEKDNVAVALEPIATGDMIGDVYAVDDIPVGHKIALVNIEKNNKVIKYGTPIGIATENINAGGHVHSHNLKTSLNEKLDYTFNAEYPYNQVSDNAEFMGYLRADGRVGVRNSIFILPTVGCASYACEKIAQETKKLLPDADIHVFTHPYGCSQLGDDSKKTAECIAALCKHPNVGGALLVSLGCENNNLEFMGKFLGDYDKNRIRTLNLQLCDDEIATGVDIVKEIYSVISQDKRTAQSISKLCIGFKCGGSDGFSGITANPLCGKLSEHLTSLGAKVILTEVPEMFGAEQYLFERCVNKTVFDNAINLINSFKDYFVSHGQPVYENPSPGNKDGGITTLEEKSLGCITKGGQSAVTDVIDMYSPCKTSGLTLLNGPGNDIVSVTNLAAAGAVIVLFTTGRGTPLGGPVPTMKLSTNSSLAQRKKHWIDYNAGVLLEGKSFDECEKELFSLLVDTANGKKTANENADCEQIAIFKDGVTL